MSERILGFCLVAAASALAGVLRVGTHGQRRHASGRTPPVWQHPRTAWGDPDLQGMWPIINLISTPFQRPVDQQGNPVYGDRAELTDEEYAATQQRLAARDERYEEEIKSNKMGMGHWAEASHNNDAARLTSLLVEPKNGRFPELTARGKELASKMRSTWSSTRVRQADGLRHVGSLHHARLAAVDVPVQLQQRHRDPSKRRVTSSCGSR